MIGSKYVSEFKEFALRGNVVDLAIGVILGTAFNNIVQSVVKDILTPPLGILLRGVNFSNWYIDLSGHHYASLQEATAAGAAVITYGAFVNNVISFLITAMALFILVRQINKLHFKRQEEPQVSPTTKDCPFCFSTIPLRATRCPQCTSVIPDVNPTEA